MLSHEELEGVVENENQLQMDMKEVKEVKETPIITEKIKNDQGEVKDSNKENSGTEKKEIGQIRTFKYLL
jgi:hypothetical protein